MSEETFVIGDKLPWFIEAVIAIHVAPGGSLKEKSETSIRKKQLIHT